MRSIAAPQSSPNGRAAALVSESIQSLLELAASVCNARFAVLQTDDGTVAGEGEAIATARFEEGAAKGAVIVFDASPRSLTSEQARQLAAIAAQIGRTLAIEAAVEQSHQEQQRLQTLVDQSTIGTYLIENDRFAYVNDKFAETLGYAKEEILALGSVSDLIADEQREIVREMIRRRETGDDSEVRYTLKVRRRDGTYLDAEIHSSIAYVDGRRLVIGAAVDVTPRSSSSRRVREREEYFRALTENASDVIAILDRDGHIEYVSPSIERILGYTPEELIGMNHDDLAHPEDRERVLASFRRLSSGGGLVSETYRLRRKDGGWRILESVGTNLLEHPQVRGIVVNTRDITERRMLEQELEQLNRLSSIGRLAAQVAHEFNNVLMGIQSVVDIVRRQSGDDPRRLRMADLIAASINRGKRITTDILRFGRPAQPTLAAVDAEGLLTEVAEEIRPLLPAGIALDLDLGEQPLPLYMNADRAQLAQVLINLALNARDAMQLRGGTLTIGVRPGQQNDRGNRFVHFTVTDTGEGIASEDLPYIFEPLFTTKKSGTGLGLSVVFQIVAAHRGHVSVDSAPGMGSTFHVYIPAVADQPVDEPAEEHPAAELPRKTRVLLVEDDEAIASGVQWCLEAEGVDVDVAMKAADVLPAVASFQPDVVVLDLNLPDDDGRNVHRRLTEEYDIPVIFSTGHAPEHEIETLIDRPHDSFLMKPYSTQDLLRAIHQCLELKEEIA